MGSRIIDEFNKFSNVYFNYDKLIKYGELILKIVVILLLTKVGINLLNRIIGRFFDKQKNMRFGMNERKANTLSELLKSISRYIIYFVVAIWIIEQFGIDVKTIIAFTGVAGVAVGFGAQNLVKDVIAGFFILFEDQFAVGDYVVVEGMSGIVETVGLRITKIKDFSGDLHIIPNGSITKVTNKSRGNMRALIEITIAFEEDIDKAISIMKKAADETKKEYDYIVDGPSVVGVTNISDIGVTIRIVATTPSMKQWEVEMELRKRMTHELQENGIELANQKKVIVKK